MRCQPQCDACNQLLIGPPVVLEMRQTRAYPGRRSALKPSRWYRWKFCTKFCADEYIGCLTNHVETRSAA